MSEIIDKILSSTGTSMQKAIDHLELELTRIRAGKANPGMLDGIVADYYGSPTPISQIANITILDARTISVQPWEKNTLGAIEKGILMANIGITPQNDGNFIRLSIPPMTEERRKDLVKKSSAECELAKIAIRNIRRDAVEGIKKQQKEGLSEDATKDAEIDVQATTDKYIATIEKYLVAKEKEIMSI